MSLVAGEVQPEEPVRPQRRMRAAIVGLSNMAIGASSVPVSTPYGTFPGPHFHSAAYAALPNMAVVAACDRSAERRAAFIANWGKSFNQARVYADHEEMFSQEQIELLSVVTSDRRHADVVIAAAAAGVRGILCEKPIATTLTDADRMIEACRHSGTVLLVNHSRRWWAEWRRARQLVREGLLGKIHQISAVLAGPRAMLFRNGTHLVDSVCFFADTEPEWLTADLEDGSGDYGPRYAGDGGRDPELDPAASAYVHFSSGMRAFVTLSKQAIPLFEVDVIGDRGRLRLGGRSTEITYELDALGPCIGNPAPAAQPAGDTQWAIEELAGLINGRGVAISTGADARRTLGILVAILQSAADGGRRVWFPVADR
jgi:predicted dehydrogenase